MPQLWFTGKSRGLNRSHGDSVTEWWQQRTMGTLTAGIVPPLRTTQHQNWGANLCYLNPCVLTVAIGMTQNWRKVKQRGIKIKKEPPLNKEWKAKVQKWDFEFKILSFSSSSSISWAQTSCVQFLPTRQHPSISHLPQFEIRLYSFCLRNLDVKANRCKNTKCWEIPG